MPRGNDVSAAARFLVEAAQQRGGMLQAWIDELRDIGLAMDYGPMSLETIAKAMMMLEESGVALDSGIADSGFVYLKLAAPKPQDDWGMESGERAKMPLGVLCEAYAIAYGAGFKFR